MDRTDTIGSFQHIELGQCTFEGSDSLAIAKFFGPLVLALGRTESLVVTTGLATVIMLVAVPADLLMKDIANLLDAFSSLAVVPKVPHGFGSSAVFDLEQFVQQFLA